MCYGLISWVILVKLLSSECHRSSLMVSQHWFRLGWNNTPCIAIYCDTVIKIYIVIQKNWWRYVSFLYNILYYPEAAVKKSKYIKEKSIYHKSMYHILVIPWDMYQDTYHIVAIRNRFTPSSGNGLVPSGKPLHKPMLAQAKMCLSNTLTYINTFINK